MEGMMTVGGKSTEEGGSQTCVFCLKALDTLARNLLADDISVILEKPDGFSCALLDHEVKIMFIVRKLLGISEQFCEEMLVTFGNPSRWLAVCSNCFNVVKEAIQIYQKIVQLERTFEALKNTLKVKIRASSSDSSGGDVRRIQKTTANIRHAVLKESKKGGTDVDFIVKDEDGDDELIQYDDEFHAFSDSDYVPESELVDIKFQSPVENPVDKANVEGEKCDICDRLFSTRSQLRTHTNRYHNGDMNRDQGMSNTGFIAVDGPKTELQYYDEEDDEEAEQNSTEIEVKNGQRKSKNYKCPHCSYKQNRRALLHRHLRVVHWDFGAKEMKKEVKNKKRKCVNCEKVFDNMDCFIKHCREDHKMIQCQKCPRMFDDLIHLYIHEERHHESVSKQSTAITASSSTAAVDDKKNTFFKCNICICRAKTRGGLYRHIRNTHWDIQPGSTNLDQTVNSKKCTQCESVFTSMDALKNHCVTVHKMLSCEDCSQVFSGKPQLSCHERIFHGKHTNKKKRKTNKCHLCSYSTENYNLSRHLRRVHHVKNTLLGRKKTKTSKKCSLCKDIFHDMDALKKHCISVHKMIKCVKCPRLLPDKHAVSLHEEKHHGSDFHSESLSTRMSSSEVETDFIAVAKANPRGKMAKCPHCNYCTLRKRIAGHVKTVHWEISKKQQIQEVFKCDRCVDGIEFQSVEQLSQHKIEVHDMVKCNKCGKVLPSLGFLEVHEKKYHSLESAAKLQEWNDTISSEAQDTDMTPAKTSEMASEKQQTSLDSKTPQLKRCKLCSDMFASSKLLKEHQIQMHAEEMFKCEICSEIFDSLAHLYGHKTSVHNEPNNPYKCPLCTYTNRKYAQVERHKRVVHKKKGAPVICEICSACYSKESTLLFHKIKVHGHVADPKYNLKCEYCEKSFSTPYYLAGHVKGVHNGEWRYKCEECNIGFRGKKQVERHVRQVHLKLLPYECPEEGCGKRSSTKNAINSHVIRVHRKAKVFKCSYCGKGYVDKPTLQRHEEIHTNEKTKPYQCQLCGKGFSVMSYLRQHFRSHKNKGEVCDFASVTNRIRTKANNSNNLMTATSSNSEPVDAANGP